MEPFHGEGASEMFQAQSHLYKHVFNFISSMSLKCAVQLEIPDIIHKHGQPITLPELVSALEIHPSKTSYVFRLMRVLVHSGIFAATKIHDDDQEEAYVLTPCSNLLLKSKSNCLSPFLAVLEPVPVSPWHVLGDWFRGNKLTAFETEHGVDFWGYANQNPEFNNLFNDAMASDSQMMNLVIRDCKPIFGGAGSLVDVGGGTGSIAKILSEAFPQLKCTVFDLPHVVANFQESENLKFVGGDMFQSIPSADSILLKLVLHAFNDEECTKILKKCREAINASQGEGGKVIIIDIVIDEKKDELELTEAKLYYDMLMMVLVCGKERTEKEWEKLFLGAGFSHYKITPIFGLRSLIEVYP